MIFEKIAALKADGTYLPSCYVGVKGAHIRYVGVTPPDEDYGERINGENRLLMPGFVNAHTHVAMTLMRGYGEDLRLQSWLFDRIFPFEDKLFSEAVYWGSLLGIAEMLMTGTTSFTDMYYFCEDTVRAVAESGIKANIGRGVSCFDATKRFADLPAYRDTKVLIEQYHGTEDGRILVDVAPHAEYTTRFDILHDAAELAAGHNLRMHIHLSETASEHKECVGRHGKTPTRLLEAVGMLGRPLTVAHGVWLTDDDVRCLSQYDVTLAHCAKSNLKLGSGVAPVEKYRRMGLPVAIGTDSAASNNALDMVDEMRMAALLAKGISRNAGALPAGDVLYMGTRAGALSQGRADCGDIVEGYRADLVVMDTTDVGLSPANAPLSNVLYGAGSRAVHMTIADGRVAYRAGEFLTLDIERVRFEVQRAVDKITGQ
ncbi:MAG: amidohydrolase [Clostridia bacterium]|nr:amidohydrolase [Clostridia bacterium]